MSYKRPPIIPGSIVDPKPTLDWLVEQGWFWRNELGVYGPQCSPRGLPNLEAYTKAIAMISVSASVARSCGCHESEVRFSIR